MLLSGNVALFIFVIILIISAVIAGVFGPFANYDKHGFHTFISVLTGLGIFIVFLFYYNVVQLQNQQQELAAAQELSDLNDSVQNNVLNAMLQASKNIPNFVLSITPLTNVVCCTGPTGCTIPVGPDPVTPEACTEKMSLSYRIFSLWQDIIINNKFIDFSPQAYVSNFLQRANSTQLFAQWTAAKLNFNPHTQTFGDLLFEYGLPITNQTPQTYINAANALIADPRYAAIFNC